MPVQTPDDLSASQLPRRAIAIVLAGGRGSRLRQLTDRRAKPAVHFGGKYRIIDFALSNCINSGFRRIYVLTQYKSHSLLRHLQRGWGIFRSEANEFVDLLPAQQRVDETMWYRGTADAVAQNIDILESEGPEYIVVLAGDHVYKMDYALMLQDHCERGADVTVGCVEVPRMEATGFGVMHTDDQGRIVEFLEKPADPPGMPDKPDMALASMGIYVFSAKFLYEQLQRDAADPLSSHDFGKDLIPYLVPRAQVLAHSLTRSGIVSEGQTEPYWRDAGTIDAYWEANLDLTTVTPALDLYDEFWPIHTHQLQLPPAKFIWDAGERRGTAIDSLVSGGCVVSGGMVKSSLLFSNVRVNSYAHLEGAVVLPGCNIGRHARLQRVVVDSGCEVPEHFVVGEDPDEDARRFERTASGVVLITRDMLARLG
ncbi:MAG TPA: glucose-1-phosphate adenylyltransferase [Alphaproteobacteria bacterium]|nr:glucose-1-phosphate adenylyltransferase [Alphaproteobacteria bacterium]